MQVLEPQTAEAEATFLDVQNCEVRQFLKLGEVSLSALFAADHIALGVEAGDF